MSEVEQRGEHVDVPPQVRALNENAVGLPWRTWRTGRCRARLHRPLRAGLLWGGLLSTPEVAPGRCELAPHDERVYHARTDRQSMETTRWTTTVMAVQS